MKLDTSVLMVTAGNPSLNASYALRSYITALQFLTSIPNYKYKVSTLIKVAYFKHDF